jgi:hypothetical protein
MANPLFPPQLEMIVPAEEEHPPGLQVGTFLVLNHRTVSPMADFNQGWPETLQEVFHRKK